MDVVVVPSGEKGGLWDLHDRLGRKVGVIKREVGYFTVEPDKDGPLASATLKTSDSLKEAMDNIAIVTKGECQLSGRPEG